MSNLPTRADLRSIEQSYGLESRSQLGQEAFVIHMLGGLRGGYFVEAGAGDGGKYSNTRLLERAFGWHGILCEPARCFHDGLRRDRPGAHLDLRALWSRTGDRLPFVEAPDAHLSTISSFAASDLHAEARAAVGGQRYEVETVSLADMLDAAGAPPVVDYLSLDTEGSELDILAAYDWGRPFRIVTVEHNHVEERRRGILDIMAAHGYERVCVDLSEWDDWYVRLGA